MEAPQEGIRKFKTDQMTEWRGSPGTDVEKDASFTDLLNHLKTSFFPGGKAIILGIDEND